MSLGYHLHENFSLTTNDIQLSDSGKSYRCDVAINDPQITGTTGDFFYNRNQLGNISVAVYGKSLFGVYTDMLILVMLCFVVQILQAL